MRPKNPVIVIAGSRRVGIAPARALVGLLAGIPPGSKILLRGQRSNGHGDFEGTVSYLCGLLGLAYEWRVPGPDFGKWQELLDPEPRVGREQTFDRDMRMVEDADLVVCFVSPEQVEEDTSGGTQALAHKALGHDKPVYLYSIDHERLERVGEQDDHEVWASVLP